MQGVVARPEVGSRARASSANSFILLLAAQGLAALAFERHADDGDRQRHHQERRQPSAARAAISPRRRGRAGARRNIRGPGGDAAPRCASCLSSQAFVRQVVSLTRQPVASGAKGILPRGAQEACAGVKEIACATPYPAGRAATTGAARESLGTFPHWHEACGGKPRGCALSLAIRGIVSPRRPTAGYGSAWESIGLNRNMPAKTELDAMTKAAAGIRKTNRRTPGKPPRAGWPIAFTEWAEKLVPGRVRVRRSSTVLVVAIGRHGDRRLAARRRQRVRQRLLDPDHRSPCRWPWSSSRDTCSPPRRSAPA